ncbi:unnamed protein product [Cuscuta campestris]|uniref:Reticulon domain-containing protein n=1 Tax=Cuscuta campestris TaxID=132261 RepID=A0A484M8K6_9ASTE|nr:unnamed protein product [Cuscuta campestris]
MEAASYARGIATAAKLDPAASFLCIIGANPIEWIKKCRKYFTLCNVPEHQKVDLATIHLKGKAETWYSNYSQSKINVVWEEFIVDLCARFKGDIYDNVVEEFNKLSQTAGLRPQVKPFVKAFAPSSLAKAISFARLQEDTLEACKTHEKGSKTGHYTAVSTRSNIPLLARPDFVPKTGISMTDSAKTPNSNPVANSYGKSHNHAQKNPRFIPATVRAEKIAQGLCYYCDKPYGRGHKCESKETHSPGQKDSQAQSSSTHSILGSVDWTGSRRCNLGMGSRLEAQIPNISTLRARLLSNGDSMIQSLAILTTWVIALAGKGAADIFLWRDKKVTAGVFGFAPAIWLFFELLE